MSVIIDLTGGSSSSSSSSMPKAPTVVCPDCTFQNEAGAARCALCDKQIGPSASSASSSSSSMPKAPTVVCPDCTFQNEAGAARCALCDKQIGPSIPFPSYDDYSDSGDEEGYDERFPRAGAPLSVPVPHIAPPPPPPPAQKKRKRGVSPPPAPTPMLAGASTQITFSEHVDNALLTASHSAPQRTRLLHSVVDCSLAAANKYRVKYEKEGGKPVTLWALATGCATELKCKARAASFEAPDADARPNDGELTRLARLNLRARLSHDTHIRRLETSAAALPDTDSANSDGVECLICSDRFALPNVVICGGENMHVLCKCCFRRYATETLTSGDITCIPCAAADCKAMIPPAVCRETLSDWEQLRMSEREESRNQRVALAAKAVLRCTCGSVGIITEEDVGNGRIACPGCEAAFCVKCGNEWHEGEKCPPPKETVEWLAKSTKPCPNCRTNIEKNQGCDHMFCAPPGGCGHHFLWSSGKSMNVAGPGVLLGAGAGGGAGGGYDAEDNFDY